MLSRTEPTLASHDEDSFTPEMMARALYGLRPPEPVYQADDNLDPGRLAAVFNDLRDQVAELRAQLRRAEARLAESEAETERATRLAQDFSTALSAAAEELGAARSELAAERGRAEELRVARSELAAEKGRAETADQRAHDLARRIGAARAALADAADAEAGYKERKPARPDQLEIVDLAQPRPIVPVMEGAPGAARKRSLLGWMQ